MTESDLPTELRDIASAIALSVGTQVGERRAAGFDWTTKSSSADVVTEIDTWAEAAIVEALDAHRPDDGLLGEEGASREGTTGVVWIIDPVDGTTNLLYDIPGYSVSIGAELNGTPVAGAVYDPVRGELFAAAASHGATRNGDPISASPATVVETALVGTGFSYLREDRASQAAALTHILPAVRDIRRLGGAALDLCGVACGRIDAYFERNIKPWDAAAGVIIAREAGAIVEFAPLSYAVAPGIEREFVDLLASAGA